MEYQTEQVIEGLDLAVRKMKKGEVALVTIHPQYAFGSAASTQDLATVPANSTVYYEIELVSFVKVCLHIHLFPNFKQENVHQTESNYLLLQEKESWELSTPEKIEAAGKKKEEGNVLFKAGKYDRASRRYEQVLQVESKVLSSY